MPTCTVILPCLSCLGLLITHFWQEFLGPNLEFNTRSLSDKCSVKETASQPTKSRSRRMNNRKLAHNGFTPPLLQSQRMCWSPMELQKAETSMSDELSTCLAPANQKLMQSRVRLGKLFLDILPIRSWFISSKTGTLSPQHHRKFPPCRTQTSPPWGHRTRLQMAQQSSKFSWEWNEPRSWNN